jgi:hypothetical protein
LPCFALPFAVGIMAKKVRGHKKDNFAKGRQSAKEMLPPRVVQHITDSDEGSHRK